MLHVMLIQPTQVPEDSLDKRPIFVANRVSEILEGTSVDQWHHAACHANPADAGTRGPVSLLKTYPVSLLKRCKKAVGCMLPSFSESPISRSSLIPM